MLPDGKHLVGVFATRPLPAKTVLAKYRGEELTYAQLSARYPPGGPRIADRVVQLPGGRFIDGSTDPHWTNEIVSTYGTKLTPNVVLTEAGNVRTTKRIRAGQELLAAYGGNFWQQRRAK